MHDLAKMRDKLCQILCHRFEWWRIWVASFRVVSFSYINFYINKKRIDWYVWCVLFVVQRLPFNWHCPSGYLLAIILQWITCQYVCFLCMNLNTIGILVFLFNTAVIKDIKCSLKTIDKNSKTKNCCKQISTEFIDLHSSIKQLSFIVSFVCLPYPSCIFFIFIIFNQSCVWVFGAVSTDLNDCLCTWYFGNMLCNVGHSNGISWVISTQYASSPFVKSLFIFSRIPINI